METKTDFHLYESGPLPHETRHCDAWSRYERDKMRKQPPCNEVRATREY